MEIKQGKEKDTTSNLEALAKSNEYWVKNFYETRAWLTLRYQVLRQQGIKCLVCNRGREDNIKIHVDHILPRSKYPHLELEITNLQVLCHECNLGKSNFYEDDFRHTQVSHE